jgi:antitoxin CptB
MTEDRDTRLRRLRMRSWRRGMREMDLILGAFADARLPGLTEGDLAAYESLLDENDQQLYLWITGAAPAPDRLRAAIELVADTLPAR